MAEAPLTGVLLVNVGTPDAPTAPAVRRYLREFLSDPRVIDLPAPLRTLLLEGAILPFRPRRSAASYQKIWTDAGSPLALLCESLRAALASALGDAYAVELGMRYGNPSLPSALERLRQRGVTELAVLPLYPQYAASSTGTSLAAVHAWLAREWNVPALRVLPPFYESPAFLEAAVAAARPALDEGRAEHLLVSFHGLPERHIRKSDVTSKHCLASPDCCTQPSPAHRFCYRAQAYQTAAAIAAGLGFGNRYEVAFQSRLGRTPWIQPYTDVRVPELAKKGVRRLGVLCPSFAIDCLETLEEIGVRAKESFVAAGGEALVLAPCVNAQPLFVQGLARWVVSGAGA